MIFNGNEITSELFILDNSNLNPLGLQEYANKIGEKLGVEFAFAEKTNGEQYETSKYFHDEKLVIIPSRFVEEGLGVKVYRAAKGAIDHETGHVLWSDFSYLPENNETDEDKELIWDIGNIIDDIRVERKLAEEFGIDSNNFVYFLELVNTASGPDDDSKINKLIFYFYWMVNELYRGMENTFITGKILYLREKLRSTIDKYLSSGEEAIKYARIILELFKSEDNKKIKITKQVGKHSFEIDIEGIPALISFSSDLKCSYKEGDEIIKEDLILVYDYILLLVPIRREDL